MKSIYRVFAVLVLLTAAGPAYADTPAHYWSYGHGGTSGDIIEDVFVDDDNNVYLIGYFQGTADFGGGNLVSNGGNDIVVAKYDASGAHVWSQSFGGTSNDQGRAVTVDYFGNVIISGFFFDTVNFGGGNLVSAGNSDMFLAKYDASGNHVWSQRLGGTYIDQPQDIVTDGGANIYLTGTSWSDIDLGGGLHVNLGLGDAFLAKFNSGGGHTWSQFYASTGNDLGYGVAVDALSRVVITGQFTGTIDFGGGGVTSAGDFDIFLAKYGITGTHIWSQALGGSSGESPEAVAVGTDGTIAITGTFSDTVSLVERTWLPMEAMTFISRPMTRTGRICGARTSEASPLKTPAVWQSTRTGMCISRRGS